MNPRQWYRARLRWAEMVEGADSGRSGALIPT